MTTATAPTTRDPHATLGVRRNASRATIDRAFRRLAMKYHPDRNIGDEDAARRMQEINDAYAILTGRAPAAPDKTRVIAYQVLANLLGAVLGELAGKGIDPRSRDIADVMREALAKVIGETRQQVEHLRKVRDAAAAMRGRFQGAEADAEAFNGMVEYHLGCIEKEAAGAEARLGHLEAAAGLLREVRYRHEEAPTPTSWTNATNGATMNGIFNFWG